MELSREKRSSRWISSTLLGLLGACTITSGCARSFEPSSNTRTTVETSAPRVDIEVNIETQQEYNDLILPPATTIMQSEPAQSKSGSPEVDYIPPQNTISPNTVGAELNVDHDTAPTDGITETTPYEGSIVEGPDLIITNETCLETHDNPNPFPEDFQILVDLTEPTIFNVIDETGAIIDGGQSIFTDKEDALVFFCKKT